MKSIKKNQKRITLVVACAFLFFIEASTLPSHAAEKSALDRETAVTAPGNDNPSDIEKQAEAPVKARKSALVPILIGVVLGGAVAAVLILVVFKTKYDITGTWDISYAWKASSGTYSQTFTGDKKSGTILTNQGMVGTYTVDGKNAKWTYGTAAMVIVNYTGQFNDKTTMKGTMSRVDGADSGTWEAHKK